MRALLAAAAMAALAASGCSSCADLSVARPFPCDRSKNDLKQCPADWRCGLAGTCFDADAGAGLPNVCEDSALDCSDGWRCGAADPLSVRRCQQLGVGKPYPCQDNTDCEADWRCDPVGHACTQVADQLATSKLSSLLVDQVSPSLPSGKPLFAAVGRLQAAVDIGGGRTSRGRVVGYVADAGLYVVTIVEDTTNVDGGRPKVELDRYGIDEPALVQLATLGTRVVGVLTDGRVLAWDRDDAGMQLMTEARRVVALSLDAGGATNYELAVLRESDVALLSQAGLVDFYASDAGAPIDVTGESGLLRVLYAQSAESWDLKPTSPRVRVPVSASVPLARFSVHRWNTLVEVASDAGVPSSQRWGMANPDMNFALSGGPCAVCPFGALALQVTHLDSADLPVLARCPAEENAGLNIARSWLIRFDQRGDCSRTRFQALDEDEAPFQFDLAPDTSSFTWRAHAGEGGRAWYAEDALSSSTDPIAPLHPVVLDRQPEFVGRLKLAGQSSVAAVSGVYAYTASAVGLVSEIKPNNPEELTVLGTVAGAGELMITTQGVFNLAVFPLGSDRPQQVASLGPGVPLLSPPASGTLVPLSTGRRLLVVASRDALYAADVTDQLPMDGGVNLGLLPPAPLAQRLVPAPGVPIRDVALGELSTVNSASRGEGSFYVLARDDVFGVAILDEDSWQPSPIKLPTEFGPPRELWTESGRGRVAYQYGYISALPTPVQLAPPLGDTEVVDFARLCGDTLAIVDGGVRRFASDAGWVAVPGIELSSSESSTARFYESGPSTFLATAKGRVLELTPRRTDAGLPACP